MGTDSSVIKGTLDMLVLKVLSLGPMHGWIRSSWRDTENGRRARYYALSRAGEQQLGTEAEHWHRLAAGVTRIMALNA